MDKLKVTLIRSVIGRPPDNAAMLGAIRKINHLVDVELAK